jgi:hypothetical protein
MTGLASPVSSRASASLAAAVRLASAGDEMAFARIVGAFHGDLIRVAYEGIIFPGPPPAP